MISPQAASALCAAILALSTSGCDDKTVSRTAAFLGEHIPILEDELAPSAEETSQPSVTNPPDNEHVGSDLLSSSSEECISAIQPIPDRGEVEALKIADIDKLLTEADDFAERMTSQPWACEVIEKLAAAIRALSFGDTRS